jgi:hypothetical protein
MARSASLSCVLLLITIDPLAAHGMGERYDLPLPLELYLVAAAVVVAFSCLVPAAFYRGEQAKKGYGELSCTLIDLRNAAWPAYFGLAIRCIASIGFILLLGAGLFGSRDPFKNPLPVFVWVIGWVGVAYICALLGNIWLLINPWDNLFRFAEWLRARMMRRGRKSRFAYPSIVGAWPAFALFWGFAWLELVWPGRDRPFALATLLSGYSVLTWLGMYLFGRETWLEKVELFSVAFGLFARFSVVDLRKMEESDLIVIRPPASGLVTETPVPISLAAFVLLMLATVTFDGLLETPLWATIHETAVTSNFLGLSPALIGMATSTAGLILFPIIFSLLYLLVARSIAGILSNRNVTTSTRDIACRMVLTIVPISIGYHLSHYLSYLLIAGQFAIPIASDPFALQWNLFGTRLYLIDFSVIDSRFVWYASIVFIVSGHIIAVLLAHLQAAKLTPVDMKTLLLSQAPMVALMTFYTVLSLWILAQPITKTG